MLGMKCQREAPPNMNAAEAAEVAFENKKCRISLPLSRHAAVAALAPVVIRIVWFAESDELMEQIDRCSIGYDFCSELAHERMNMMEMNMSIV